MNYTCTCLQLYVHSALATVGLLSSIMIRSGPWSSEIIRGSSSSRSCTSWSPTAWLSPVGFSGSVADKKVAEFYGLDLVGGFKDDLENFPMIYGMSSFPLTNSYFSRWFKPPTRIKMMNITPEFMVEWCALWFSESYRWMLVIMINHWSIMGYN